MIVYDRVRSERHPAYQQLATANLTRQYGFLRSIITAALTLAETGISESVICTLNHHAIAGLHTSPGKYRTGPMTVGTVGRPEDTYVAPPPQEVPDLMASFVAEVNEDWEQADAAYLASYCLWRLNFIHPFVNGNGRTARALCFYVLCLKLGYLLPGKKMVPELIRRDRNEYVKALRKVDEAENAGQLELGLPVLTDFVARLLTEQMQNPE